MIPVELEYRPIPFIPWTRRIEKKLPARWSELSESQAVYAPLIRTGALSDRKLLQIFLGLRKRITKRIDGYQAFCITRLLRFLDKPEPLDRFMISSIAGFKAPGRGLKGVTFGAFIFGDTFFQSYMSGKELRPDKFIACFYTSGKFNENEIERNAAIIANEKPEKRVAIAVNYGLIREWMALAYPFVFQKKEVGEEDKSKGWVGVFDQIVQDDLANQDKYAQLPVSTVLRNINNRMKNYYKNGG
jgi:hypothetical protein